MTWSCTTVSDGVVHVTPDDDLVLHDLDSPCVCVPSVELVRKDGCPDGYLYIHYSLDRREVKPEMKSGGDEVSGDT